MKTKIDLDTWYRKEHFNFFNSFEEPLFGATVNVDVTIAYQMARQRGTSFFLYYLHCILEAANKIEAFKYRVEDGEIFLYDTINCSTTVARPDTSFGFSYINYTPDFEAFSTDAQQELDRVKGTTGL